MTSPLRRCVFLAAALTGLSGALLGQAPSTNVAVRSTDVSVSPASPVKNSPMTYTITVRNLSSNQAKNVTLMDILPGTITSVSGSAPGGSCDVNCPGTGSSVIVTCSMGNLTGSATATATITLTPTVSGTQTSVLSVAANEFDTDLSDNAISDNRTINSPPAPAISGLSRSSGTTSGGDSVIIFGSNFVAGATAKFGTTAATVVSVNVPSQITVTTPGHVAGPVGVTVTNPDLQSSAPFNNFTYQCPNLSISPSSLPAGVVGVAYSQTLMATFGSTPYSFGLSGSPPGWLTLSTGGVLSGTPTGPGTFSFTVTVTDLWQCTGSRAYSLTISPLTLTSIFPTFGVAAGGTRVTLYGAGFQSGASVKFGAAAGTYVTFIDSSTLQATTPGGTGSVDVIVANPDLSSQRLTNGFRYGGVSSYSVPPCRIIDTRGPTGPYGGPALNAGADRPFVFVNQCGIPSSAKAVILNVVAIQPTNGPGFFTLYPGGTPYPVFSTINYVAGQILANNAIVPLGSVAGDIIVHCQQGAGTAHMVIDVSGYLQ